MIFAPHQHCKHNAGSCSCTKSDPHLLRPGPPRKASGMGRQVALPLTGCVKGHLGHRATEGDNTRMMNLGQTSIREGRHWDPGSP